MATSPTTGVLPPRFLLVEHTPDTNATAHNATLNRTFTGCLPALSFPSQTVEALGLQEVVNDHFMGQNMAGFRKLNKDTLNKKKNMAE